jgi:drug/metabolite transporter (DMT)-like permease
VPPIALNGLRITGAAVLFWILFIFQKDKKSIQKADFGRLVLCMFTGVLLNQVLFVKGVSLSVPSHASLLMLITPVAVVFISGWLLQTNIYKHQLWGLVLGIVGAAILISLREPGRRGHYILLGDALIIINAISYAVYLVLVKPLMSKYSAMSLMRWMFTLGVFAILPFCIQPIGAIPWSTFNTTDYTAITFIILAVTFLAYLFNIYSVRILGPTITGAYIYSQPLFATLIALFITNDYSHPILKLVAAICIFLSVYLVSFYKKIT